MKKLLSYIQLINSDGIGPVTFYKLLEEFGSAEKVIENLPSKYKLYSKHKALEQVDLAKEKNIEIIAFDDERYPSSLKEINDYPPIIYAKGNIELLSFEIAISIVGARNASINGRKAISKLAYELTTNNILVVSGMARGIDSAAHKGAMHALEQNGPTIAVFGTGVDIVYPSENLDLYNQICKKGLIISEFPIGTQPQAQNFPRRNRIVSALSFGTLVGEASLKSGSLITAKLALEQGKDVFAIPGTPDDSRASGPNKLIKDGAILVENVEDILENINFSQNRKIKPIKQIAKKDNFINALDINEKKGNIPKEYKNEDILNLLSFDGVHVDEIIRNSGLGADILSIKLLELELDSKIERKIGNKIALKK